MTNITEAQRELLTIGAAEPDGVIDAPQDGKITRALIKRGLAISPPVDGSASQLIITEAGRAAITEAAEPSKSTADAATPGTETVADHAAQVGNAEPARAAPDAAKEPDATEPVALGEAAPSAPIRKAKKDTPSGKLGKLMDLLKRPQGATVEDMVAATGWQVHSVRGAMSGSLKKGFGFAISSEKTEAGRVYKIATGEAV